MRKLPFYVCTAMLAVGAMTSTAYGMTAGTYNIPGGRAVVIGGSNVEELKNVLGQIQGSLGGSCSGNAFSGGNNLYGCGGTFGSGDFGSNGCGSSWSCGNNGCADNGFWGNNGCADNNSCGNGAWADGTNKPDVPDNSGKPSIPVQPGGSDKPDVSDKVEPENPGQGTTQDAYAAQVVKLVNEERAKAGLSALTVHTGAESAAMVRAKEIERSFSHTRPDGSSFYTALQAAGIRYQSAGENIAYGQTSPAQVMDSWMNSSGHRANILNANYDSIAVAHYQNGSGVDYWVQLFLK